MLLGMRHVSKEEDQVRWEATVWPLSKLQDRVHLYTCREEAKSSKRVSMTGGVKSHSLLIPSRAKYIEGLENRLGRMESLLRLSGLLSDEDGNGTDLGTLEKRLQDRTASKAGTPNRSSEMEQSNSISHPEAQPVQVQSEHNTPQQTGLASPASVLTSPDMSKENKGEEEVEALSDMMCSLVTNNCGETRYIGMQC